MLVEQPGPVPTWRDPCFKIAWSSMLSSKTIPTLSFHSRSIDHRVVLSRRNSAILIPICFFVWGCLLSLVIVGRTPRVAPGCAYLWSFYMWKTKQRTMGKPGMLQSMGSQRVGHDWATEQQHLGGPVVKNLSSNAGDASSIPGWGTKILHATGQLTPPATTTEPAHSGACVLQWKDPACCN